MPKKENQKEWNENVFSYRYVGEFNLTLLITKHQNFSFGGDMEKNSASKKKTFMNII